MVQQTCSISMSFWTKIGERRYELCFWFLDVFQTHNIYLSHCCLCTALSRPIQETWVDDQGREKEAVQNESGGVSCSRNRMRTIDPRVHVCISNPPSCCFCFFRLYQPSVTRQGPRRPRSRGSRRYRRGRRDVQWVLK